MSTVQDPYRPPSAAPGRPDASTGLYAGFWRRGGAWIIDWLILLIPSIIVNIVPILGLFLQIGLWAGYKAIFEAGERQATPGKRAMGIKVTTLDGERISVGQAIGRSLGSLVSWIILGIGFFMAGFTERKQALHDMMASTLVVNEDASDDEVRAGGGTMPMTVGTWIAAVFVVLFPFGGVGILAAIAIPAYQDYTVRAKMVEVINETSRAQPAAGLEITNARAGTAIAAHEVPAASRFVRKLTVDPAEGTIRAEVDTEALKALRLESGAAVVRTLNKNTTGWSCSAEGIPNKYLPATCRS